MPALIPVIGAGFNAAVLPKNELVNAMMKDIVDTLRGFACTTMRAGRVQ